jgi:inosine-uridine nucleoside N-ribohydrolase
MIKVVIDTDLGSDADDSIALALALASPELDIRAVTVVGRQSLYRSQIAREYLSLAGRNDIPVYAGLDIPAPITPRPSEGTNPTRFRFNWFNIEGAETLARPEQIEAVDALISLFSGDDALELVAIGPMTNIYEALKREPGIAKNIRRLTVMGGYISSVKYAGHVFPFRGDYNLCSDAQASLAVLRNAEIPIRLVTPDVTLKTWLTQTDMNVLRESESPFLSALVREIDRWTSLQERGFGYSLKEIDNIAFLHDPLTVACVWDESFCRFEDLHIENLITQENVFRTVSRPNPIPCTTRTVRCATGVAPEKFRAYLVQCLRTHFG